jgi:UDP-N-acetylmuramate--alanine ligase
MNPPFGGNFKTEDLNFKQMNDEIKRIESIYFIGIGGIGMSAIAKFFDSRGKKVSGYDKTKTALTKELEKQGIAIHYDENIDLIPKDVQLVVYTPAVPKDHKELIFYQAKRKQSINEKEKKKS